LPELIAAGIATADESRKLPPPESKRTMPSVHLRGSYGYRANRR
jgi:hypothetical protein